MNKHLSQTIAAAKPEDAEALAKLIDIAGEGIPSWLWQQSARPDQSALSVGIERARRDRGGFSYTNARVARCGASIAGMVLSYPITQAPDDDPATLPGPIAPFVTLEALSVNTLYVNALAVFPAFRGKGIGTSLLHAAGAAAALAGFEQLSIQVVAQNFGAMRLYKRFGFREIARTPVLEHPSQPYYTGDVVLLVS